MTDREILELAAKAAGITLGRDSPWFTYSDKDGFEWWNEDARFIIRKWNPMGDDGDALRLAGRLHIGVRSHAADHWFQPNLAVALWGFEDKAGRVVVEHGDDPQRAIRRAIVRAAAAIQQSKEAL